MLRLRRLCPERGCRLGRYVEYGLAEKGGISVAALQNNAGAFVTPWQANITRMANEIALPPSAASAQWEHVNFLSLGAPGSWLRPHACVCRCAVLAEAAVCVHADGVLNAPRARSGRIRVPHLRPGVHHAQHQPDQQGCARALHTQPGLSRWVTAFAVSVADPWLHEPGHALLTQHSTEMTCGCAAGYVASTIMKEFTLYLLSDAVQMCLQNYGYTAIPLKVGGSPLVVPAHLGPWMSC